MITGTLKMAAQAVDGRLVGANESFAAIATDTRTLHAGELFVALKGGKFDGHRFIEDALGAGASGAVVDQRDACALPQIYVKNTRRALGALARFWRDRFELPVIGVTGSNGKTTVKEMLAAILRLAAPVLATEGNFNNDIGVPLTLLRLSADHQAAVIEIGANHFGEIACLTSLTRPTIGLITNAGAAHLEGFGSVDGVAQAKAELIAGLGADATAIINADDDYCDRWRSLAGDRKIITFGVAKDADIRSEAIVPAGRDPDAALRFNLVCAAGSRDIELGVGGRHNVVNALAAAAAAMAAGSNLDDVAKGLRRAQEIGGRLNVIELASDIRIVDDTYNANPASLKAAMEFVGDLGGRAWLVLGDMGELGDGAAKIHEECGRSARAMGFERLFTAGPLAGKAASCFGDGAEAYAEVDDLIAPVCRAVEPGVIVLIKASRLMHLETVVAALKESCAGSEKG